MIKLEAPFLEFNFYFSQSSNEENYQKLENYLMKNSSIEGEIKYLPISVQAQKYNNKPIAIWTSGSSFSYYEITSELYEKGLEAYHTFKDMIINLGPDYGAITVDYSMECPYDTFINKSYAFSDFYLSTHYFPSEVLSHFIKEMEDLNAYIEFVLNGYYISSSSFFNPARKKITNHPDTIAYNIQKLFSASFKDRFLES
jgi:hypothetical protein